MTAPAGLPDGAAVIGDARSGGGERMAHVDPSTGRVQGDFVLAGADEVDAAVAAAADGQRAWAALDPSARRDRMLDLAAVLGEAAEELATIRSLETGVPFWASAGLAPEWFRHYAGWADKLGGETVPTSGRALDYTLPEPYGVVGVLIPWNAPLDSIGMKVAPALAAGNAVVVKPSELAPFGAIRFAELCLEAGLPPGVVNVVPGAGETGAHLVGHPGLGKITFTGGGGTARRVLEAAARVLTPVLLELGGKSANVVFEDGDLDAAAEMAVHRGVAALSGQACVLPTRLLVQDRVYDDVMARVLEHVRGLRVGRPFDGGARMGPVISEQACERILGVIERAREEGGELLAGGHRLGGDLADGFFIEPTVFGDVDPGSELATNEVFGPVLSVSRFRGEEEAVGIANATRYGLGAFVFTRDLDRGHRVARALEAGSVGVNGFPPMSPAAPFGGVKESGYGREGGLAGLREFVRPKNVYTALEG